MSQYDPYQPPRYNVNEPTAAMAVDMLAPSVVLWYRLYCGLLVLLYLAVFVGGLALVFYIDAVAEAAEMTPDERMEATIQGYVFLVIGIPLAIFYGIAAFVPRKKWGWIYGIVAIAFSLTSCLCWLPGIPLLIFWLKDDNKAWFNTRW